MSAEGREYTIRVPVQGYTDVRIIITDKTQLTAAISAEELAANLIDAARLADAYPMVLGPFEYHWGAATVISDVVVRFH